MIAAAAGGTGLELPIAALVGLSVLLLALSFLFSGTETAMFSLQKVDLQRFSSGGPTSRRVVALLRRRGPLILTILMGNEVVNILLATTGADLFADMTPWPGVNAWINILVVTPTLVLVSEITPKVLAFRFNTTWARVIAWPLTAFYWTIALPRLAISFVVDLLARIFRVTPQASHDPLDESELLTLLDQGAAAGHVDDREVEIIENVFEFDELVVGRLMTPRPDIVAVPLDVTWETLLHRLQETGYSRIPVYGENIEDIVGVLLLKDLLKLRAHPPGPRQLRSMLLPPTFVPQSKSAADMLREFLERNFHLGFVVDEHGTLVGLITLDDLLGELFGELPDEDGENGNEVERTGAGMVGIHASLDIEDLAELTTIQLPPGDYHTVGGFVFHRLGRLPRRGDVVEHEGHRFMVRTMDGRRVAELWVELARTEEAS